MRGPRALIGITTYGRDQEQCFRLPAAYVDALRRAGGLPVLLTHGDLYEETFLEGLEGVVLTGGGDLDPALYGGERHPSVYMIDAERDRTELDLTRKVVAGKLPVLCICRGLQVLNVALGGSLVEHLPDQVGYRIAHRVPPRRPSWHEVHIAPGSRLAGILGTTRTCPASWHHQAVARVAPGLQVAARAPDQTIEALEMSAHPWLVAVQWHPELTAADDPAQQALFDALVEATQNRDEDICDSRTK